MKQNKTKGSSLAFILGILLIAVFLQTGGLLKGNRIVFPGLPEIGEAVFRLLGDGRTWLKIETTMLHVAEALLLSAGIGILIGLLEGSSNFAYSFFRPVMWSFPSSSKRPRSPVWNTPSRRTCAVLSGRL